MKIARHSYWIYWLVSVLALFIALFSCLAGLSSRPGLDEDHQRGIAMLAVPMFIVALVIGSIASPVVFICLRHKRLAISLPIIFVSPAVCAFMLTALDSELGIGVVVLALIISLLGCTLLPSTEPEPTSIGASSPADADNDASRRRSALDR